MKFRERKNKAKQRKKPYRILTSLFSSYSSDFPNGFSIIPSRREAKSKTSLIESAGAQSDMTQWVMSYCGSHVILKKWRNWYTHMAKIQHIHQEYAVFVYYVQFRGLSYHHKHACRGCIHTSRFTSTLWSKLWGIIRRSRWFHWRYIEFYLRNVSGDMDANLWKCS